jgi:hypothetical protein
LAAAAWRAVDIATGHAGARGATLDALVRAGTRGLVVAGKGNGSVHREWLAAARRAEAAGVRVVRASRCQLGGMVGTRADEPPSYGTLTAPQARVELMIELIATDAATAGAARGEPRAAPGPEPPATSLPGWGSAPSSRRCVPCRRGARPAAARTRRSRSRSSSRPEVRKKFRALPIGRWIDDAQGSGSASPNPNQTSNGSPEPLCVTL